MLWARYTLSPSFFLPLHRLRPLPSHLLPSPATPTSRSSLQRCTRCGPSHQPQDHEMNASQSCVRHFGRPIPFPPFRTRSCQRNRDPRSGRLRDRIRPNAVTARLQMCGRTSKLLDQSSQFHSLPLHLRRANRLSEGRHNTCLGRSLQPTRSSTKMGKPVSVPPHPLVRQLFGLRHPRALLSQTPPTGSRTV